MSPIKQSTNTTNSKKILRNPKPANFVKDPRGLGYLLNQKLQEHGNKIMQIDAVSGEEDTFENFRRRCVRVAIHLKAKGIAPLDRIAVLTNNTLNSTVPLVASLFVGAIPIPLDPTASADSLRHYLQSVNPKLIFACPEVVQSIENAMNHLKFIPELIVFGKLGDYQSFENYVDPLDGEEKFEPFQALSWHDTSLIMFSSGTTGKPKPTALSHYYFYRAVGGSPDGRHLLFASPVWISAMLTVISNMISGFTRIVCPKYNGAEDYCELVNKYKVTSVFMIVMDFVDICQYCVKNNITLPGPQYVLCAGCPISPKYLDLATKIYTKAIFINVYAQTETGGISCCIGYDKKTKEKYVNGSVGKAIEGVKIKIVDPETEEILGPNQQGEIRVKCNFMMNGYLNVDSSKEFDSDGWFKTEDLGYYDEEEYIFLVGRLKELMKYRGFPVCPGSLEDILSKHPSVEHAVVTSTSHEIDGDHPVAFVKLHNGFKVDTEEIRKFVDEQVDDVSKLRGGVFAIKKIPLTTTGKPHRLALQKLLKSLQNGV